MEVNMSEIKPPARDVDVSENEIRELFRMVTFRQITARSVSVGKCIAKAAQWHIVEALKLGLMPIRVGNYYLIKAEVIDDLFKKLDQQGIPQNIAEISEVKKSAE
jgi:hypothetical protein